MDRLLAVLMITMAVALLIHGYSNESTLSGWDVIELGGAVSGYVAAGWILLERP